MPFDWYQYITSPSREITQGDIIQNCPIPLVGADIYKALMLIDDDNSDDSEIETIETIECDVVVLTQACDMFNSKVDSVVLCPVWKLSEMVKKEPFNGAKVRERLRTGRLPAYHLLNESTAKEYVMDFCVVDFHKLYTLPKAFLEEYVSKLERRIRVLPPYREHLSQAFARYFMRVGLPTDIDQDVIKKYKAKND